MRHIARAACIAPVVALLAACSSTPPSSSPVTSSSPSSPMSSTAGGPASSAAVATPAATPATGAQLKAALVTDVPPGFALNPEATADTGSELQHAVNGPALSATHCADLDATSWIQVSGMSGVSFAQSDYLDGNDQEIAQEVDAFDSPEHAARALSQLKAFMTKCATFKDSESTRYRLAVSSVPGLGAGAVKGVIESSRFEGGVVEVASVKGNDVITVLYSATKLSTAKRAADLAAKIRGQLPA